MNVKNGNYYGVHDRISVNGENFELRDFSQAQQFTETLTKNGVSAELEYYGGVLSDSYHTLNIEGRRFDPLDVEDIVNLLRE